MAAPSVVSSISASPSGTSNVTTHNVDVTSLSLSSGDLAIMLFMCDGGLATTDITATPTGWTIPTNGSQNNSDRITARVLYRFCDGTSAYETGNQAFTTNVAERSLALTIKISGHHASTAPECANATANSGANPDPPSLTPAGGADDYLFLAFGVLDRSAAATAVFSAGPSGYSGFTAIETDQVTGGVAAGWAYKQTTGASSDDPGVFTISTAEDSITFTVAVYPGAATSAAKRLLLQNLSRGYGPDRVAGLGGELQ